MKVEITEVLPAEYFATRSDAIWKNNNRGDSVRVLWTSVPNAGFRLALCTPPAGFCWGMQFNHAKHLDEWMERLLQEATVAVEYRRLFGEIGIDPANVPETLAGCSLVGENHELAIGTNMPDLPRAWFRTALLPDTEDAINDFVLRLHGHLDQLGDFFLLPQPEMCRVALRDHTESVHPILETLFGTDHDPKTSASASLFANRKEALNKAIASTSSDEAMTWLTSRFLDWDLLRPSYPMAEHAVRTKKTAIWGKLFSLRSAEDLHNERKILSLLRTRLMRKWKWPVGIRLLEKYHKSLDFRAYRLEGQPPWQELEHEVSEVLRQAKTIYPILFD